MIPPFLTHVFVRPQLLLLIFLVPVIITTHGLLSRRRTSAALLMGGVANMKSPSLLTKSIEIAVSSITLIFLVVGLSGPQWGRDPAAPPALGRDIHIALDVSRSMLAEGPPASRLDRAKRHVSHLLDHIQHTGGYRISLTAFAGKARLMCPLTDDYDHVRAMLSEAHADFLGPGERIGAAREGTNLANALAEAKKYLDPAAKDHSDLLLISDGDDLSETDIDKAPITSESGMPIHAFAVGAPNQSFRIPVNNTFLEYEGRPVTTQRRDSRLRFFAESTDGRFLSESDDSQELIRWFQNTITSAPLREWVPDGRILTRQWSGYFYGAAILAFLAQLIFRYRPRVW